MLAYKYLPPERIDVIRDGRIRFTPPSALNDPFECTPIFNAAITVDALRSVLLDKLRSVLAEVLSQPGLDKQEENEARSLAAQAEDTVARITDHETVSSRLLADIRAMVSHSIGVLSLSKIPANPVMWDRYAGQHRGFLLGLDSKNDFHMADALGRRTEPLIVDYVEKPPVAQVQMVQAGDGANLYKLLMGTKPIDWQHEQEVRLTRSFIGDHDHLGADQTGFPIRLFFIEKEAIRCIVLGASAGDGLASEVERQLERHRMPHVQIKRARFNPRAHRIEIVPYVRS